MNGSSLEVLNKFLRKDENNVIFFPSERIRPPVDANTFNVTDNTDGIIDENHLYSLGKSGEMKKKGT